MKTLFKSAIMLLTCGMFFACSSDDTVAPEVDPTLNGGTAYLSVNVKYVNDPTTRALGGYENADGVEKAITTINFYFYDKIGQYITGGSPFVDGTNGTEAETGTLVQFERTGIVALHGLKGTLPTQMLCVINKPSALSLEGKTFNEANSAIEVASCSISDDTNGFIMTSTTYSGNTGIGSCAVVLTVNDFHTDENHPTHTGNAVDVYVERVAVKVKTDAATGEDSHIAVPAEKIYKLGSVELDGTSTDFYAKILGWGLNVTSRKYTPYKSIDPNVTYWEGWSGSVATTGAANNELIPRSYWGEAPAYDDNNDAHYAANENDTKSTTAHVVDYISWENLGTALGSAAYCAPNTHSVAVLAGHYTNRTTNVLVKALLLKKSGTDYVNADVCRFAGKLYTPGQFTTYVLAAASPINQLWRQDETDPNTYRLINTSDLEFYNIGDGKAGVRFTDAAAKAVADGGPQWYTAAPCASDAIAGEHQVKTTDGSSNHYMLTKTVTPLQLSFASFEVDYYNDGMMYYTIPIEHNLDPARGNYMDNDYRTGTVDNNKNGKYAQVGDYGVVRNHAYSVTINKVANFGHAVFDKDKLIVPNDDDNKEFWLGTDINVLAWKTVTQGVEL